MELFLLKAESRQWYHIISHPESAAGSVVQHFVTVITVASLMYIRGWGSETTYSLRWPLLSVPLVQPHHWRHCTRSPRTALSLFPGFPSIHLHSQSPQLQEKVWWNREQTKKKKKKKKNTTSLNLENNVEYGYVCRELCHFYVQILKN